MVHKEGGQRLRRNRRTSANKSSRIVSSWRLNELTEGVVTIEMRNPFQNLVTRIEKDAFLRIHRLGPCRTSNGWPFNPGRTGRIKRGWGPDPILQKTHCMRLWGFHRDNAYLGSADPAVVGVPHMAVGANHWIRSKQSASAIRFGEQACLAYSKWGRTNVL